jgi:hypothetical protein
MSNAKTLLEFAGAQSKPASLTGATVIIIDAQNEYVDGQLPLHAHRYRAVETTSS